MKIKKISNVLYIAGQFFNKRVLKKLNLQVNDNATKKMDRAHIVLANHCSVMDYRITTFAMRKDKAYHVTAKNIFANKKWLVKRVGGLSKVQFVPSLSLIKQIKQVLSNGNHVLVFPEGVISFDGTNRILSTSVSKLIKHLNAPVAVLNIKGTYLAKPRYNESKFNKVDKLVADFDVMLDEKQVADMSVEQIHDTIKNALHFDVWEWNKQNGVKTFGDLVTGLNNLLFDCVYCHGKMEVCDGKLTCSNCGKQWDIDEYYRLSDGKTELTIAEWFDKQRQYISKQLKDGDFVLKGKAKLQVLDGYKGFKQAGSGVFSQDLNGVTFDGTSQNKPCKLNFDASKHWSAPAGNGFVELSQYGNTYRFVFDEEGIAIKSALAVEESFKLAKEKVQIDF